MKTLVAFLIVATVLTSCQGAGSSDHNSSSAATDSIPAPPKEDSATTLLRNVITPLVKADLEVASSVRWMYITQITHRMISLQEYYTIQKDQLQKNAKASTNKEKTEKALAYLDAMIAKAPTNADVYQVQFHLAALLSNTTKYDEDHTRYLGHDLKELKIVFPG